MWRLYPFLRWLWYGVLIAILVGIFVNLVFAEIRPEVLAFFKSQYYFVLMPVAVVVILTFCSWRSFVSRAREKSNLEEQYEGFKIADKGFWEKVRLESDMEHLCLYYVRTDSTFVRLLDVVANDYYIRNDRLDSEFSSKLDEALKSNAGLVKLLSKAGEGKSTFLYHIAKEYADRFTTIIMEDVTNETIMRIEDRLGSKYPTRPALLVLDNASVYEDNLVRLAPRIVSRLRKYRFAFIVAERDFRYEKIEDIAGFESNFSTVVRVDYSANHLREKIFSKLFSMLVSGYGVSCDKEGEAKRIYLSDSRRSISECTCAVIDFLKTKTRTRFSFDWEDWDEFASPGLQRLYLIVSTFYQFGYDLDIDFCASLLDGVDYITISSVLSDNPNLPICKRRGRLQLRHETLASWYLDPASESTRRNREHSEHIFERFLNNIRTPFARDLFIWLCIKNRDFSASYLSKHLDDNRRIRILIDYIACDPAELKCRTELAKIYQYQKKHDQAEQVLQDLLSIDPQNLQARTELAKIYQYQKKHDQAEQVLLECINIHSDDLDARTELAKIYQYQKKHDQAEKVLLECINIHSDDLDARTELAKIYQYQKKHDQAETVLQDLLSIDPQNLQARTELAKIYQYQKKHDQAEQVLLECINIHSDDLDARTELAKIYQYQKKHDQAEQVLLECINIHSDDLDARTELAKIYQYQKKHDQAEKVLLESLAIDNQQLHPRTELAKIYQYQKKHDQAEQVLQDLLSIDPQNLQARTELAKIYQYQKKHDQAETVLQDLLSIDPQNLQARTELAKIYQYQKKHDQAETVLQDLLSIDPQNLQARTELAKIYQYQNKHDQAEKVLLESLTIDNQQLHPRTELAKIYQYQKKHDQAEKVLLESLAIDNQQLHPRTELAKIYQYQKKHDQAEKVLLESLAIDNQQLHPRTELAKIYQYQKKHDQAETVLQDLLSIDPQNVQARTELAKIYQYQKKHDQAEKVLLELLDIAPTNFYAMAELVSIYDRTNRPEECFETLDAFLKNLSVEARREPQATFNNVFRLCSRYDRPDKAEEYYAKYSTVLDERNIALFIRLFGQKHR
jgi:tetratricopeptide (TPR) repeat protein